MQPAAQPLTWHARAGVLPFAKRGDNRTNNLIRLQQMFPRIVAADFHTPMHVSEPCQHLLRRMLTADPEKRITIQQVLQHPWLQTASPPCTKVASSAQLPTAALCASGGCTCSLLAVPAMMLQKPSMISLYSHCQACTMLPTPHRLLLRLAAAVLAYKQLGCVPLKCARMQGLNERLLQQLAPEGLQTVQEIEALVTEVRAFLAWSVPPQL